MSLTILFVGTDILLQVGLFRVIPIPLDQRSRKICYSQLPTNDSLLSNLQTNAIYKNKNLAKSVEMTIIFTE